MVQSMRRPDTLKGKSLLVARLQASQVVGLIHCSWLRCLCASVCRFVSCLNPADAGSVLLHTVTGSHGRPILWTAILPICSYTPV